MTAPLWIDRPEQLVAGVERWRSARTVALDTEFVFERTFRPRLGLIQIAAGGEIALVDAVRIADLAPLAGLLQAPEAQKILHSGSGDIPILRRASGGSPRPLFDTQIAAAFAGLGVSLSYAALIRELFAVELPKHETRTDWLRRPLSPEQLRYAAEDVEHLGAAAAELERRLRELGRLEWALEDSAELALLSADSPDPAEAWRRVKGLERLPPRAGAVARALAAWREHEADRLDLARSFLMRDETLLALARRDDRQGLTAQEAAKLPGYDLRRHAQHAARWAEALSGSRAVAEAGTGGSAASGELARSSAQDRERRRALEDAISALVSRRASEVGIPPELLLSRRQRDRALSAWRAEESGSLAGTIGGFRGQLLGAELDALAAGSGRA